MWFMEKTYYLEDFGSLWAYCLIHYLPEFDSMQFLSEI